MSQSNNTNDANTKNAKILFEKMTQRFLNKNDQQFPRMTLLYWKCDCLEKGWIYNDQVTGTGMTAIEGDFTKMSLLERQFAMEDFCQDKNPSWSNCACFLYKTEQLTN